MHASATSSRKTESLIAASTLQVTDNVGAIVPEKYKLWLDLSPNSSVGPFGGRVRLEANVIAPTTSFELHAKNMEIASVRAFRAPKNQQELPCTYITQGNRLRLNFAAPLDTGPLWIEVRYRGQISDGFKGLYLDATGERPAIVSQCEAAGARRILPSLDIPSAKARFRVTIDTEPYWTTVANGAIERTKSVPGRDDQLRRKFAVTPAISTYLLGFAIGDYEATPTRTIVGKPVRVVVPPGKAQHGEWALDVTERVLPYYEAYFDVPYPFDKLDHVGVGTFDAGAMENPGIIIYRQSALLADAAKSPLSQKMRVAEIVAHEVAHQWFGNLVTMQWWDDLLLNEAFATWMSNKFCHAQHPQWQVWDQYIRGRMSGALSADALANTHSIHTEVLDDERADENFDSITYGKGSAVVRMIENYLGEATFREGVRAYIQRFQGGNAQGHDLWNALQDAAPTSAVPVSEIMESWIKQPGHPLVEAALLEKDGVQKLHLKQQRFFADPEAMRRGNEQLWKIPIVVRYEDETGVHEHTVLQSEREQDFVLPAQGPIKWFYPNADITGFYRSKLDPAAHQALLEHGLSRLSTTERAVWLDEQWAEVRAGALPLKALLDSIDSLKADESSAVASTIADIVTAVGDALPASSPEAPRFAAWVRSLYARTLQAFDEAMARGESGFGGEAGHAARLEILATVGGETRITEQAARLAEQEMRDPESLTPAVANVVLRLAARQGDEALLSRYVEVLQARRQAHTEPSLQDRYVRALRCFERCIPAVLQLSTDRPDVVLKQDRGSFFSSLLGNSRTQTATWTFVQEHWPELKDGLSQGFAARSFIRAAGQLPASYFDSVQHFLAQHLPEWEKATAEALESITALQRQRNLIVPQLEAWLG